MLHASPQIRVVSEPVPVGDVPLPPAAATGRSEAEFAQAMADRLFAAAPQSDAPLAARLGAMLRRASHWH